MFGFVFFFFCLFHFVLSEDMFVLCTSEGMFVLCTSEGIYMSSKEQYLFREESGRLFIESWF